MRSTTKRALALVAAAFVLTAGATTGAVAGDLIGSSDVKDNSLRSKDLHDGTIKAKDVNSTFLAKIANGGALATTGAPGPAGPKGATGAPGLANVESDGPYPGATNLSQGDNSTAYWTNDGLNRSWVACPAGKVALGGGFTLASDASESDKRATTVTASQPTQIRDGAEVYEPIEGDADGSFLPNAWLVEGFYDGDNASLIVRPHVVCATVAR